MLYLGRLLRIVPPSFQYAPCVFWLVGGPAELVQVGNPMRSLVPVRDPVASGADEPVQGPASRRQFRPGFGGNHPVDHGVDCWIGDAGEVLRALEARGLRREIAAQRVSRRG